VYYYGDVIPIGFFAKRDLVMVLAISLIITRSLTKVRDDRAGVRFNRTANGAKHSITKYLIKNLTGSEPQW
jgi:hypothetical protein